MQESYLLGTIEVCPTQFEMVVLEDLLFNLHARNNVF